MLSNQDEIRRQLYFGFDVAMIIALTTATYWEGRRYE